jgi:hypothetical protein
VDWKSVLPVSTRYRAPSGFTDLDHPQIALIWEKQAGSIPPGSHTTYDFPDLGRGGAAFDPATVHFQMYYIQRD